MPAPTASTCVYLNLTQKKKRIQSETCVPISYGINVIRVYTFFYSSNNRMGSDGLVGVDGLMTLNNKQPALDLGAYIAE